MSTSGASTHLIREMIDGEVPLVAVGEASAAVSRHVWDVDFGIGRASGVIELEIPRNIDPEGFYEVRTDPRAARQPPAAATMAPRAILPIDEPVARLIVQGDMKFFHQRAPEEPPVHFLEGEADESDEDEGEVSRGPPEENEEKVATLGVSNKTAVAELEFVSVVESYMPAGLAKK